MDAAASTIVHRYRRLPFPIPRPPVPLGPLLPLLIVGDLLFSKKHIPIRVIAPIVPRNDERNRDYRTVVLSLLIRTLEIGDIRKHKSEDILDMCMYTNLYNFISQWRAFINYVCVKSILTTTEMDPINYRDMCYAVEIFNF